MNSLKICNLKGVAGLIFFLSGIFFVLLQNKKSLKKFENSLNKEQIKIYNNIVKERLYIYIYGHIFGFAFALLYLLIVKDQEGAIWGAIAIMSILVYIFYIFHPKSNYMIYHLNTKIQRENWIKIYRHMTLAYHSSFIFSLIATFLLFDSICTK